MSKDSPFLDRCRLQFKQDCEQERKIREQAKIDIEFLAGDQWEANIKQRRMEDWRAALTFNKLHTYLQSVANEVRQNKPQAKAAPLGGGATTDVATVTTGILRHVQYRSQADVASDTAVFYAAGCGMGYMRWYPEAVEKSFDQELRIDEVMDPFSVYGILIPTCRGEKPDHGFVVRTIPKAEYKRLYGKKRANEARDFDADEWRDCDDWLEGDNVRIAEYWRVEKYTRTLREIQGQDGSVAGIYTDDPGYSDRLPFTKDENGQIKEREEECRKVYSCVIDGAHILEPETEFIIDEIPINPVLGMQLIDKGEIKLFSLVRFVREPQQLINIYKSAIAENVALANRVPYIGPVGTFKDPRWSDANRSNYAYLEYTPVFLNGNALPPPQRQAFEPAIQALSEAVGQEIDDLKSGMGIFDASLGSKANETSGLAIQRRANQSNIINFHFVDNLQRGLWAQARQLLKAIPIVYWRPGRQVRIVGEDQEHSVIVVNQKYNDPDTGREKHYPLAVGDYDIVIRIEQNAQSARQETQETLGELIKAVPAWAPLIGDLYIGSFDTPWSREAARRLKLAAPQQIVNEPQDQGGQQIPPQIQQAFAQMQQKLQTTEQFAQSLHQQLEAKLPEIQSKEKIEKMRVDADLEKAKMESETKLALVGVQSMLKQLQEEIGAIKHESNLSNQRYLQTQQHGHEAGMQATQQAHDADQTANAQEFQADQADSDRQAAAQQGAD